MCKVIKSNFKSPSAALISRQHVNRFLLQNNRNLGLAFEQRPRSERKPLPIGQPRRHSTSVSSSRSSPNLITLTGSPNKRERALSLSAEEERRRTSSNSSRYKTELCRPFEENGTCKYGDKCQFAHGVHELRSLSRHPKYKTELCRTFHTIGFCPYGPRCHFIHNAEERRAAQMMNGARMSPPSQLIGPPSPPLTEPSSPLPTSLTPPSPSQLSFYNDDSPLGSPINSPLAIPSPASNNVFTFPSQAQDFSPVLSPTMASPPGVFSPGLELNEDDDLDEDDENLPPTPPDSYDLASRRRLPVFNRMSVPE